MSTEAMPPLPEPKPIPGFYEIDARKACRYTASDMHAYARTHAADLERRLQEAGRADLDAEAADELERKKAANEWDNFNDVVPTLKAARDGSWQWYRNMRCKYIVLRIDMRDLGCIIKDREGERITVSQLQHQHASAPSAAAAAGKEKD